MVVVLLLVPVKLIISLIQIESPGTKLKAGSGSESRVNIIEDVSLLQGSKP